MSNLREESLRYHSQEPFGKIAIKTTKPCVTAKHLSLAYTPGVAEPVLEIAKDPLKADIYTNRSNLVAVVSNGTAILGLGNRGALASKPVMEGKAVLFKRFADVDAFDLEINSTDSEEIIRTVKLLEPTFGGINLEDIKAPECFIIEQKLKEISNIPIFHDDQHGTAIITAAGVINAAKLTGRKLQDLKTVICGAGAAGMSCAKLLISMGVQKSNILMCDMKGVIHNQRTDLTVYKQEFAIDTDKRTLADATVGADLFVGVSVKDALSPEMLLSMNENPIVFAMANPDPEIDYNLAISTRSDIIMATGRSDFPNQINNVLGFPFIFRGALDVGATCITEKMKIAAAYALAELARQDVPKEVLSAYDIEDLKFGKDYIVPKPFDRRVLVDVSTAVAKAAIAEGVAKREILDWDDYKKQLEKRVTFK